MKLLLTGATGNLGSKIVDALLKHIPANEVAVSVRDVNKAQGLRDRGIEVRHGDFDHPETLDSAFAGIDRLLIISADGDNDKRIIQHKNAVEAAKRAGVIFIAYTSLANATKSKNLMAPPHTATEEAIIRTGIPYSFLRNNWYYENELGNIQGALAGAPWVTSAGTGKVGWALRQDYADAAAAVLLGKGSNHNNTVYELSGPLLTVDEFVLKLGEVLNKEIPVQHVTKEEHTEVLKGLQLPDFLISLIIGIEESIKQSSLDIKSNDFEKILGRPVTPTKEALAQLVTSIQNNIK